MRTLSSLVLPIFLAAVPACRESDREAKTTVVFAAASLTASLQHLGRDFEARHPDTKVDIHFAGTPQLVLQIREGAPVDVFASADETSMGRVLEMGKALAEPALFAHNRLTIVTAKGNPKGIGGLTDLARDDVRVVLCGPEVPAGRYARQALEKAGVAVRSLSDEPSVKAVVSKVHLGEVDAGIVYVTDAASAVDQVDAVAILDEHNVIGTYPIVLLGSGANRAGAQAFLDFVRSAAGQAILQHHGFSSSR